MFVTALQDQPDVYRYHPLFAEVLRAELSVNGPDAEATQQLLACRWYEAEGRYTQAVEQAVAGGQHGAAFDLIVAHLRELYGDGQRQAVGRWLVELPDSFIEADPARAVDHCGALLFLARTEWIRWHRRAHTVVEGDRLDLRARLELYQAVGFASRGYLDRAERQIGRAITLRSADLVDPFDEVFDVWQARLLVLHGDTQQALVVARDVRRRSRQLIRDLPATSLLVAVSVAAREPGAKDLTADVIAEWRSLGEPDYLGMADALCVASELALSAGDLDEAENLAAGAVALTADRPPHLLSIRAAIALANVETASGQPAPARRRLADMVRQVDDQFGVDPAITALLEAATPRDDTVKPAPSVRSPLIEPQPGVPSLIEPLTQQELIILGQLAGHRTYPEIGREFVHLPAHRQDARVAHLSQARRYRPIRRRAGRHRPRTHQALIAARRTARPAAVPGMGLRPREATLSVPYCTCACRDLHASRAMAARRTNARMDLPTTWPRTCRQGTPISRGSTVT